MYIIGNTINKEGKMKKTYVIIYIFIFLFGPIIQTKGQVLLNEKSFSFGGKSDMPFSLVKNAQNNYFVSGLSDNGLSNDNSIVAYAGLIKFDSNFNSLWTIFNPVDSTVSNFYSIAYSNIDSTLFWFSRRAFGVDTAYIAKINAETGNVVFWEKANSTNTTLGNWDDKILFAEGGSPAIIRIINSDGSEVSNFQFSSNGGGNMKLATLGDYLWVSGYSNGLAFVGKYHLPDGAIIWKKTYLNVLLPFGELDKSGNFYFFYSELSQQQGNNVFTFTVIKHDSDGNVLWTTKWLPWEKPVQTIDNGFQGVAVNEEKNVVIGFGAIHKLEDIDPNSNKESAYMVGLNMTTGDTVWSKSWDYPSQLPVISRVNAGLFDDDGNLVIVGNSFSRSDGAIPNVCYLSKYKIDKVTGIEQTDFSIPSDFVLSQNYPNPFNPSTRIRFSVAKPSFVTLKVYDLLGREVTTLVNGEKSVGSYEVTFNTSELTSKLSSGIYIYRLTADKFTQTKKMILMK